MLWYERGKTRLNEMKVWAERGAAWNFSQKLSLLQAEDSYCLGDMDNAKESYKQAIAAAKRHKYTNEMAISLELAARFFLCIGELKSSLEHFTLAHEAYGSWGAMGKAEKLFNFVTEQFAGVLGDNHQVV